MIPSRGLPSFSVERVALQLEQSLLDLEGAVALVAPEWIAARPPWRTGSGERPWSVAMNLAHLAVYEELLAAPVLEAMAEGGDGRETAVSADERSLLGESAALSREPLVEILTRLGAARARQVQAVRTFSAETFNRPLTTLWGDSWGGRQPAGWVALKTVQHTWEHGTTIFQVALFAPR